MTHKDKTAGPLTGTDVAENVSAEQTDTVEYTDDNIRHLSDMSTCAPAPVR